MKVLHVISGIGRQSGGPSRSSQGLVAALCKAGVDVSECASGKIRLVIEEDGHFNV